MAIPHATLIAQTRQRQIDIANEKIRRQQQKQAFTSGLIQLGLMAAGTLAGAGVFGPALGAGMAASGGGAGGMMMPATAGFFGAGGPTFGTAMMGAGLGGSAGGLLGRAVTGQQMGMGDVMQGVGMAANIFGRQEQQARYDQRQQGMDERFMWNQGYERLDPKFDEPMADDVQFRNQTWTPREMTAGRGAFKVTTTGFDKEGRKVSVITHASQMPVFGGETPDGYGPDIWGEEVGLKGEVPTLEEIQSIPSYLGVNMSMELMEAARFARENPDHPRTPELKRLLAQYGM